MVLEDGETEMLEPVPTHDPVPHPFLYQRHVPPEPVLPVTVRVVDVPAQIVVEVAVTFCGPHEVVTTLMVTDLHAVVLQVPSARTK